MSLKEKIVSKFNSSVNFKLFLAVAVSVSLLVYAIMIFIPAKDGSSFVPVFNQLIYMLLGPGIVLAFIVKPLANYFGASTVRDSDGYEYKEIEQLTWRKTERSLIIGFFLGLMTVIYFSIFSVYLALFSSENVKAAKKAAKTNLEVILIVLAVIVAIVIFFGGAIFMYKLIEKKGWKNKFYAVFFGLAASYITVNFTSIVAWLFSK